MTQSDQPSGDPTAADVTTATSSFSLDQYYREKRDNFRRELPEAARQLKEAGVKVVHINYDGCGDSGQIESVTYLDAEGKSLDPAGRVTITEDQLMDLLWRKGGGLSGCAPLARRPKGGVLRFSASCPSASLARGL